MTAQTPAPTASGAPAPLAFFSAPPLPATPAGSQDFSSVIFEAISPRTADLDSRTDLSAETTLPSPGKHGGPDDTHAGKANGAPPQPGFLSSRPPSAPPAGAGDTSDGILEALNGRTAKADSAAAKPPETARPAPVKHTTPEVLNPDPSSLLLALLTRSLSVPEQFAEWRQPGQANRGVIASEAGTPKAVASTGEPAAAKPIPAQADPKNEPLLEGSSLVKAKPSAPNPKLAPIHADASAAVKKLESSEAVQRTHPKGGPESDSAAERQTGAGAGANPGGESPDGAEMAAISGNSINLQENAQAAAPEKPPLGTAVATSSQRMNFKAERNKIAGRTEQKVPPAAVAAVTAADPAAASGPRKAKSKLEFAWCDTPAQVLPIVGPAIKAIQSVAETEGSGKTGRVEQMVSREIRSILDQGAGRLAGGEKVGVSLKVDANTQLFLELTSKNGQLQASLRCERGDFTALASQWTQLQQSLARQNVQLAPLGNGVSTNFQQQSRQQQRQLPPSGDEGPALNPVVEKTQTRKSKPPGRSRQHWESWA